MNTLTNVEVNELTAARFAQINFIAGNLVHKLPLLRETGRLGGLSKSIVRSEITHYVISALFNVRQKSEVKQSIANTDLIQSATNKAVLLDTSQKHLHKLKALFVESLFSPTRANKRSRIITVDGNPISAEEVAQIQLFAFLGELIQLSVIAGCAEAGYSTFRRHSTVEPLWSLMPSAGDLRIASDLSLEEKGMRDFIIKNDSDYHFCIHFCYPIDDPRYNTEEELLIITNEESCTPLSQLKQRIQHVRDYDRFKTCRVFVVNLNNEIHPVSEPLSAFELKGELEERSIFDVDVCSVVDFAEIRDLVCHKFELDSFERNKK